MLPHFDSVFSKILNEKLGLASVYFFLMNLQGTVLIFFGLEFFDLRAINFFP